MARLPRRAPRRSAKKLVALARAWCGQAAGPDTEAEALAAFGLQREDKPDEQGADSDSRFPPVLPENRRAWGLWCALETQWRTGFNGRTGLDYGVAIAMMRDVTPIKRRHRAAVLQGLHIMEREALTIWNKKR